jgi:hypothetical protein
MPGSRWYRHPPHRSSYRWGEGRCLWRFDSIRRLKLQVNAEKSAVGRPWQRSFLPAIVSSSVANRKVAGWPLLNMKAPPLDANELKTCPVGAEVSLDGDGMVDGRANIRHHSTVLKRINAGHPGAIFKMTGELVNAATVQRMTQPPQPGRSRHLEQAGELITVRSIGRPEPPTKRTRTRGH